VGAPADNASISVESIVGLAEVIAAASVPVGTIIMQAGGSFPGRWLWCNGSSINSISNPTYADLYSNIGTIYGGTGPDNFFLPDLRGRSPIGAGSDGSTPSYGLGGKYGSAFHTLTVAEMPQHSHNAFSYRSGIPLNPNGSYGIGGDALWRNEKTEALTTSSAGGNQAFNIVHPSLGMYYYIKY
jgi:microcystin-dependent protein